MNMYHSKCTGITKDLFAGESATPAGLPGEGRRPVCSLRHHCPSPPAQTARRHPSQGEGHRQLWWWAGKFLQTMQLCRCGPKFQDHRVSVQEYLLASIAHRPFFWATFTDSGTALHTLYSASVEILSIQRCQVMAQSCLRGQTLSFSEQPLELLSCYCSTASVTRRLHCTSLVAHIQVPGGFFGTLSSSVVWGLT